MALASGKSTFDFKAAAAVTARQALKLTESGSSVLVTPCTADTDFCIGWALGDAAIGEDVVVYHPGIVEFIAGEALDASSDAGKRLILGLAGRMYKAAGASDKVTYLRWVPQNPSMVSSNGDVAAGGRAFGVFSPSVDV